MTPNEITDAVLNGDVLEYEGYRVNDPKYVADTLVIDNFAVIPIAKISSGVSQAVDIEVVDLSDQPFGTICFTKNLGTVTKSDLTLWQFIAYLGDADPSEIFDGYYMFKRDYLILEADRLTDYLENYYNSAPIWGRFSHLPVSSLEHVSTVDKIVAIPNIEIASPHHQESFNRYLHANNPLERFLRIYHSIELLFDYVIVKKIKSLEDDIFGFSQLLTDYGRVELDRLKAIMKEFCLNSVSIGNALEKSSQFSDIRYEIFFRHNKAANPYGDTEKWEKLIQCIDGASFNESTLRSKGLCNLKNPFDKVTIELAAYWIYRIRCSIAHNRVGGIRLRGRAYCFYR